MSQTPARFLVACLLLPVALLTGLTVCSCKSASKTFRVGILSASPGYASTADGFRARMTELGYVEGRNVTYRLESLNFDPIAERRILDCFVADGVDLIFVYPTEAAIRAKAATRGSKVPMVFANATIEGVDLVESVRAPGGNLTGVRYPGPAIAVKRLEILHELAPRARRILVPYQRGYASLPSQLDALRPAADAAGLELIELPVSDPAELEAALDSRARAKDPGLDAILMNSGPLLLAPGGFAVVARFAAAHRIPVGGVLLSANGYTSLFGATVDNVAVGRQAAALADKVLRGTPAGTIPVASAEVALEINDGLARSLGLVVPNGLLRQATRIIR